MTTLSDLQVKIFADGADTEGIAQLAQNPIIKGFTTNPTLMRAAGVADYEHFARGVLNCIGDLPISFEVFADDFDEMIRQARKVASWGEQIHVKIPIANTKGESSAPVLRTLAADGVKLNVTALLTVDQVRAATACPSADAGRPRGHGPAFPPRADLGQPPRDPQHHPGGLDRLQRDHGDPRHVEEAAPRRGRSSGSVAGHREDVPS